MTMDVVKNFFQKLSSDKYKCLVRVKTLVDGADGEEIERRCDAVVGVGKESCWNLKRHLLRSHENIVKEMEAAEQGIFVCFALV